MKVVRKYTWYQSVLVQSSVIGSVIECFVHKAVNRSSFGGESQVYRLNPGEPSGLLGGVWKILQWELPKPKRLHCVDWGQWHRDWMSHVKSSTSTVAWRLPVPDTALILGHAVGPRRWRKSSHWRRTASDSWQKTAHNCVIRCHLIGVYRRFAYV